MNNVDMIYLYGFSLHDESHLNNVLNILKIQTQNGVRIKFILLHDGVIGISRKGKSSPLAVELLNLPINFYALKPDLLARGIDDENIIENVSLIEYEDLVDLLAETPKIISWV